MKTLVAYTAPPASYPQGSPPYFNVSRDGDTETVTVTVRGNPDTDGDIATCGQTSAFRMSDEEWQALRAQIAADG